MMIPNPLHPAIVHFPIALVALLPVAAALAVLGTRRGIRPRPAWVGVVALSLALLASTWFAVRTGEAQEDTVERVVGEAPLHEHEEAAETFLALTLAGVVVFAAGLAPGRLGSLSRFAGLVAALLLPVAGLAVGRTGGALVYEHGAAQAYVSPTAPGGSAVSGSARRNDDDDDDHDRDDRRDQEREDRARRRSR